MNRFNWYLFPRARANAKQGTKQDIAAAALVEQRVMNNGIGANICLRVRYDQNIYMT